MTTPDEAKNRAEKALVKATEIRDRGVTIAERWRRSQEDNNFRQMLRQISRRISNNVHP